MRLICGIIRRDGHPVQLERLEALIGAQTPPGLRPRVRRWIGEAAALAVLTFAPAGREDPGGEDPESLPQGPGGWVLAADLRLDDPEGLAHELGRPPLPAPPGSGHEALALAAIEQWGEETPVRLLGDFALAAWNPRTRHLWCARDSMGVRPLCYTRQADGCFAFASFARALVAAGFAAPELDTDFVVRSGILDTNVQDRTPFPAIAKLRPAHQVALTARGLGRPRRYWQLDAAAAGTWRGTPEEAAAGLARRLTEAVRCRIAGAGPVATHLSGGLDSSAITVLAARLLRAQGRPLHAYAHLAAPVEGLELRDEGPFVEAVLLQEPGIASHPIAMTGEVLASGFEIANGTVHARGGLEDQVCAHAAAQGAGCVLSGWGGDQGATFSGAGALRDALLHGRWRYLRREFQAAKRLQGTGSLRSLAGLLWSFLPPPMAARLRARPQPLPFNLSARLSPLAARALRGPVRSGSRLRAGIAACFADGAMAARNEDHATVGARHGVSYAFPMQDRRLVEFVHALPKGLFVRDGINRRIFRDAMAGVLPELIRWRGKRMADFPNIPVLLGARKGRLLEEVAALRREPGACGALFDLEAMETLLLALPEGKDARGLSRDTNPGLWPMSIIRGGWTLRLMDIIHCLNAWDGPALAPRSCGPP